jgi:proliferating cell nuclear antigen
MEIIINDHSKAECFTTIFQHMKTFTDFINISFDESGLSFQSMDNSHVSVVELSIPETWFSQYKCIKSIVLGINISILHKILATKEKNQILHIVYENENDTLEIHFLNSVENILKEKETEKPKKTRKSKKNENNTKETEEVQEKSVKTELKSYDKHFQIPLVDLEMEVMEIPGIDYEVEFSLASANFSNIVTQLKMFGDSIEIQCSEEKIILNSNSSEIGKMSVEISVNDLTEFSINEGCEIKQSFSLLYLNNICMFHRLAKEMNLKISSNYPLYTFYDLGEEAHIIFYLAPKIEDDE